MTQPEIVRLNQVVRDVRDRLYKEATGHELSDIRFEMDDQTLKNISQHAEYIAALDALIAAQDARHG